MKHVSKDRSSHRRFSKKKKVILKIPKKFTGKHLSWGLFFNKVAGMKLANFLKTDSDTRCFPVNFAKFLRVRNTSGLLQLAEGMLWNPKRTNSSLNMYFTKRICEDNKLRVKAGEKPKCYFITKSFYAVLIPEM